MVNLSKLTKKRLGELLVDEGLIKEEHVQDALKRQKEMGELLGESLVKLGYVTEYDIARAITKQFGLPFIDASKYTIPMEVLTSFGSQMLVDNQFVPLDRFGNTLIIAVSGLMNLETFEEIERVANAKLFIYVSTSSMVIAAIKKYLPDVAVAKG